MHYLRTVPIEDLIISRSHVLVKGHCFLFSYNRHKCAVLDAAHLLACNHPWIAACTPCQVSCDCIMGRRCKPWTESFRHTRRNRHNVLCGLTFFAGNYQLCIALFSFGGTAIGLGTPKQEHQTSITLRISSKILKVTVFGVLFLSKSFLRNKEIERHTT